MTEHIFCKVEYNFLFQIHFRTGTVPSVLNTFYMYFSFSPWRNLNWILFHSIEKWLTEILSLVAGAVSIDTAGKKFPNINSGFVLISIESFINKSSTWHLISYQWIHRRFIKLFKKFIFSWGNFGNELSCYKELVLSIETTQLLFGKYRNLTSFNSNRRLKSTRSEYAAVHSASLIFTFCLFIS
jgi:hypothetical protein